MANTTEIDPPRSAGRLFLPLMIGLALAALAGGGGYWAVTQGPLARDTPDDVMAAPQTVDDASPVRPSSDIAFVPLETVIVTLGPEETGRHLIFTAELEVPTGAEVDVTRLRPRILDVLNSYLRVVSLNEFSDPTSLARLRAQMLRRVQVVAGPGQVNDLLVTQFVVN